MKSSKANGERALSFLAAACYLVSAALCGLAAYAFAGLTAAATAEALHRLLLPAGGMFRGRRG